MSLGQAKFRESIDEAQERLLGRRYRGVTLASIDWEPKKIERLSKWIAQPKGMLVLVGPPGTGKTHACAAVIDWIHGRVRNYRYHDEKKLFERLRGFIADGQDYSREIPYLIDDDFVMLNDLGSSGFDKERYPWREEVWFSIIDALYNDMTPTLITTNLNQAEMARCCHPRLISRIFDRSNTIIDLDGERDYREES